MRIFCDACRMTHQRSTQRSRQISTNSDPERLSSIVEKPTTLDSRTTSDRTQFGVQFQHCRHPFCAHVRIHDRVDQQRRDTDRNEKRMERPFDVLREFVNQSLPGLHRLATYSATRQTAFDGLAATLKLRDMTRYGGEIGLKCPQKRRQLREQSRTRLSWTNQRSGRG